MYHSSDASINKTLQLSTFSQKSCLKHLLILYKTYNLSHFVDRNIEGGGGERGGGGARNNEIKQHVRWFREMRKKKTNVKHPIQRYLPHALMCSGGLVPGRWMLSSHTTANLRHKLGQGALPTPSSSTTV